VGVVEIVNRYDIIDDRTTAGCKRKVRKKFEEARTEKHKSKMFQKSRGTKGKPVVGIRRMVGDDGG
jgi:hypothetical protein